MRKQGPEGLNILAGNTWPESARVSYKVKGRESQHSLVQHSQGVPITASGRQGSFLQLPTPPWGQFRPATLASCALPPHPTPYMKAGTVSAFSAVLHSQGCFSVQQMFRKYLLSEGDGESWVGYEAYPRSAPLAATGAGLSHKTEPESGQGSQPAPQEQRSRQPSHWKDLTLVFSSRQTPLVLVERLCECCMHFSYFYLFT